jgi:tellurium resistance protein TerD
MLQLNLAKPGDAPQGKIQLNLSKGSRFHAKAYWADGSDLDVHALMLTGGKVTDIERILSYATSTQPRGKPFSTPCGSLHHSGDARTGVSADVDEIITIDGAKLPAGVDEVAIFITVYDQSKSFGSVAQAGIRIENEAGKVLEDVQLSGSKFAGVNVVQLGTLVNGPNGWEFSLAGTGLVGDLNTVLSHLS